MFQKIPQDSAVVPKIQDKLTSLAPTWSRSIRNTLLWIVPASTAISLGDMLKGSMSKKGVFKEFIEEIQNGLVIKVGSSELFGKLITRYINETLRNSPSAGDLLEFADQNQFDLSQAYNSNSLDKETKELYKQRVFQRFMANLGPHGLKFIQNMQPKDSNSWIAKIITKTQSDLPAPTVEEFELLLKDAFRQQGSVDYVSNFSAHFLVKKILGAGTVGIAALIEYKSSESAETKEYVAKVIRKGSIEAFQKDFECLSKAAAALLAQHEITPQEAQSFMEFNQEMFSREMQELNPTSEMCHLSQAPYQKEGVCMTVKGNLELAGKAKSVVFMEKASGIEVGKYLQVVNRSLANANTEEEKKVCLEQIATVRTLYAKLALLHFKRSLANQSVHADLHPGNLFLDEKRKMLWVLDLGSMINPIEPAEHLGLHRFLFALNLSLCTADSHFLRLYYQTEIKTNQKLTMEQIEPMLGKLQKKLDSIVSDSVEKNVIDVNAVENHMMGILKDSILSIGVHIVPSALFMTAKANAPVNDALNELRYILASSAYAHTIPYEQRTQFVIALRASLQTRSMQKSLWTKESWDYFLHHIFYPRAGFSQLQFEKKFMYGVLGLIKQEGVIADVLIPATVVTTPIAAYVGGMYLKKLVNNVSVKLPQIIDSYQVMQKFLKSREAGVRHLSQFFARYQGYDHLRSGFSKLDQSEKASTSTLSKVQAVKQNVTANPSSFFNGFKGNNRLFFRYFTPGVIVGGLAVEGYRRWRSSDETPENRIKLST